MCPNINVDAVVVVFAATVLDYNPTGNLDYAEVWVQELVVEIMSVVI